MIVQPPDKPAPAEISAVSATATLTLFISLLIVGCTPRDTIPWDASTPPDASPDKSVTPPCSTLGKPCTEGDTLACGDNGTCLLLETDANNKRIGVCTCSCLPDDPLTAQTNEDSCPDQKTMICGRTNDASAGQMVCYQRCTPTLGKNGCKKGLACLPRSEWLAFGTFVCALAGCSEDLDCPISTAKSCDPSDVKTCTDGICRRRQNGGATCDRPGRCDVTSGLCTKRDRHFLATAKVGDPCASSLDCGPAMICLREVNDGRVRRRNGMCIVSGCLAGATVADYGCPAEAACYRGVSGGACFRSCDPKDAATCRGQSNDRLGDYECRPYQLLKTGGRALSDQPICDLGENLGCGTLCASLASVSSTAFACRSLVDGKPLAEDSKAGLCLDQSAAGPLP